MPEAAACFFAEDLYVAGSLRRKSDLNLPHERGAIGFDGGYEICAACPRVHPTS